MRWNRFVHKDRYMCNKGRVCSSCGVHMARVKGLCMVCYNNSVSRLKTRVKAKQID